MLVIRRKQGESVMIGPDVEIAVLEISGNRVKLGIIAASEIPVVRKEVALAADANRLAASADFPDDLAGWAARLRDVGL